MVLMWGRRAPGIGGAAERGTIGRFIEGGGVMGGTSQKQAEANRRNARRSTGPRTAEGKRRSRRNGLRHGLAAGVLVPSEEHAAFEAALNRWEREAGPDNVVEAQLIRRAAVASVTLERIERANEEARERAAREAVGRWERRMQARARKAGQRLRVDPVGAVEELEATAFGCDWMIRQWRTLEAKLRQGWAWGRPDVQSAQLLLGLPVMVPGPCAEPASRRLWGLSSRANPTGVEEPPPSPSGDQDDCPRQPGEAWRALAGFVAEQIDRLIRLRDASWEAAEGPECAAIARLAAAADTSPEGQLRHRYEVAADRSCNAAIRLFLNLRDRRRKELLAIAREAAEIGDTPKAPVGGGWWREADSHPAPSGFARVDLPSGASGGPAEATPTAEVASTGRPDPNPIGGAADGPEPTAPSAATAPGPPPGGVRVEARPTTTAPPSDRPRPEEAAPRPADTSAGRPGRERPDGPGAPQPSEAISAGTPTRPQEPKSLPDRLLERSNPARSPDGDRRTEPVARPDRPIRVRAVQGG